MKFLMADAAATGFGVITSPVLRAIAKHRMVLPRFQRFADQAGFQLRSTHYYEPTYREQDLPDARGGERDLPGLELNEAGQIDLLEQCRFADELRAIPVDQTSETTFAYRNQHYSFGDAEMLYNIIRLKRPKRIIEIGSGNSTKMARLALAANERDDPGTSCEHLCIEPYEMPWLEKIGVEVIRRRVEDVELSLFDRLKADDILFIDSSHVIRPYGDVLVEFQNIIPRLQPGVMVHVHDIFTPRDYPQKWLREQRRLWNEQYLLEAFLTFNDRFEVMCALNWLRHNHLPKLSAACPMLAPNLPKEPGAFWFRRKA